MRLLKLLCAAFCLITVAACSSGGKEGPKIEKEQTAEMLFERASAAMEEQDFKRASQLFDEVERQHPYSDLATQAQIMSALASYKDERYDDSVITLEKFIQLHPGNERIDYAYYLIALNHYDQINDVSRDQDATFQALSALDTLTNRFPSSEYRRDANIKRDLVLDHLAGKEMEIGRYYLNRGHINAALNRFQTVIDQYQTTTHAAEALHRVVECYITLGIKHEAQRVASVLGHNYPGSEWYERTYKLMDDESRQQLINSQSRWDRTVNSIFKPD